jgi:putative transposase
MEEWLVTLRKHRNYCLAERKKGFETNNHKAEDAVVYEYGAFCDLETQVEYGASCPLTCPVVKHGVLSATLLKVSKKQGAVWRSAGEVQSTRTSELRGDNRFYKRIYSGVLQGNIAKLDAAYSGFFQHKRGFPAFRKRSNFNSFQYKPGQAKLTVNRLSQKKRCYSHIYLPGIGAMRYLDSRTIPENADIRTIVVLKEADGWTISVLLDLPESLPEMVEIESVKSAVGIDVGINKLISLSDGSFVENPRASTHKRIRRRLRIRQRRVNRKVKGSRNRSKAGIVVARLHRKVAHQRSAYQWKSAHKVVRTADAVVHEDLNIKGMKSRCKPKKQKGRFLPNGQSAKRGLNRSISDAAWGELFEKIAWLGAKSGKPVLPVNPRHTSQECSTCHHVSKDNREGEKFLCEVCGHIDHADTQASRTILGRAKLKFVSTRRKNLPGDSRKVTPVSHESAPRGKRIQGRNRVSKADNEPEKRILVEQLRLFE